MKISFARRVNSGLRWKHLRGSNNAMDEAPLPPGKSVARVSGEVACLEGRLVIAYSTGWLWSRGGVTIPARNIPE